MSERRAWPRLAVGELRLAGSRIYHQGGALSESFANAKQSWSSRSGVLLEIWDHTGQRGIGEASPLLGYSSETLSDCVAALTGMVERVTEVDEDGWPVCPWLDAVPAARFAWESALCDLLARSRGISVAELIGPGRHPSIPRNAVVRILPEARLAFARGIKTFKIKVGNRDKEADEVLHLLSTIRREMGDQVALRIDANGAWTPSQARANLARYAPLDIEFVEQPTSVEELATLGVCAIPWAADESLAVPSQIDSLLRAQGCVAWVLKPAMLGLRRARELAELAQSVGVGVVITHLLDGPVGLAAACELALSLPMMPLACGLDSHPGLSAWPEVAIPHHLRSDAEISATGATGLGFVRPGVPWI